MVAGRWPRAEPEGAAPGGGGARASRSGPDPLGQSAGGCGAAVRQPRSPRRRACLSVGAKRPRVGWRGRAVAGVSLVSGWVRCPRAQVAERALACLVCGVSGKEGLLEVNW